MKYLYIVLILFLAVGVMGADFDSTVKVRAAAYKLLQMDTTGTSACPTADMDQWVNFAMRKVNEDLSSYKRNKKSVMVDGTRLYSLDSCVQINQCMIIGNDSIWGLEYVDIEDADMKVFGTISSTAEDFPTHYFIWGDSIGLLPTPTRADSFWVLYTHTIPNDSMRLLPLDHRYGVVLYAAYLAALDTDKNPELLLKQYYQFITTKKPDAVEGK